MSEYHYDGTPKHICKDVTCHRGTIGDWNWQFPDGPCKATDCQWPKIDGKWLPARKHFSDTPSTPIFDAGKAALKEKQAREI